MKYIVYKTNVGLVIEDKDGQLYTLKLVDAEAEQDYDESTFEFQDHFDVNES